MKFFTFNSLPCAIWLQPPNYGTVKPKLTPSNVTATNVSIRNTRSRILFNNKMRWKLEFTAFIGSSSEASEVREGLGRLRNELVFMPVWVDETGPTADIITLSTVINVKLTAARYSNYLVILDSHRNFEIVQLASISGTTYTLAVGTVNSWSQGDCVICPLLAGRFDPRPVFNDASDSVSEPQIVFLEDCDVLYALSPLNSTVATFGPGSTTFSAATVWDIRPDFVSQTDSTEIDISNDPIGFYRRTQHTVYTQAVRRVFEYEYTCTDRGTIQKLEYLFSTLGGSFAPFFTPTWRSDLILASNLPGTPANQIIVNYFTYSDPNFNTTPGKAYLALSDLSRVECVQVTNIAGNTLTCQANVRLPWVIGQTQISNLVLVTLRDDSITWTYESSQVATVKIKMIEVTEEYDITPFLSKPVYLYRFWHMVPTPTIYRFTSDEGVTSITSDGTYLPGPFNHKGIKYSLDPTQDEAVIESYDFIGNPLSLITKSGAYGLNGKLLCEIFETQRGSSSQGTAMFWGIAVQSDPEGNKFTVTFRPINSVLEQKSRMIFQHQCVWDLYSNPGCTLSKANFQFLMTVISVSGTAIFVQNSVNPNNLAYHYFTFGYIETAAKTDLYEIRSINWSNPFSTAVVPVFIQVTRPFINLVPGDVVYLYPGCGKRYLEDCIGKFGNQINFGGEPYIPIDPPNVIGVSTKTGSGGGGKGGGGGK